jgi:signal transduction histidine kinase/DNA-binding response OmpR family regulator/HPt (histidine-containing phosphotransfer) domain-containing protein
VPPEWVEQLLAVMDEAVFLVDADGSIEHANSAASRITGLTCAALEQASLSAVLCGAKEVLAELEPGTPERADLSVLTSNGLEIPVEATFTCVSGQSRSLCVVRDASLQVHLERELRVAREAALAAARERTMFLATMSHEIRTPLNGVIGMAGLLADSTLNPEQREMVRAVSSSGATLLDLVNDILDFTRIDSGQIELEVVPFDLGETTEEIVRSHAASAAGKGIDLVLDIDPTLPARLSGDPGRFRQALGNLVGNAVKFTEGGHVVVTLQVVESDDLDVVIECEVRDTGVGISDELREVLFRPFVQADLTTSRRHGGSGLGLAIARRIIRLMGGELELDSAPGRGSRFVFRVGLRRVDAGLSLSEPMDLAGTRTLVVSELPDRRVAITRVLQSWGGNVASCAAAAAPRRVVAAASRASPYDLVIVDEPVAGPRDLVVARELGALDVSPRPTIMLLTTARGVPPPDIQAAAGIAVTLVKPLGRNALRRATRLLLRPAAALAAASGGHHAFPRLRGEGTRVLIAEDNSINQKVAVGYLAAMGVPADAVGNGLEAVEAVRRFDYTLVLMDVHMPEIDGISATAQIRRNETRRRVPIVGLTADVRAEARARTLAVGMDAFIPKPVTPQKLAEVLQRWIPFAGGHEGSGPKPDESAFDSVVEAVMGQADNVLDTGALRRLRSLERASSQSGLVDSLVGMFLDKTPARLERIVRACEASQHGFVEIEAHSLKSSCRNLGAERMGACAAELERRAQAGFVDPSTVARLAREFQTVASILRRL